MANPVPRYNLRTRKPKPPAEVEDAESDESEGVDNEEEEPSDAPVQEGPHGHVQREDSSGSSEPDADVVGGTANVRGEDNEDLGPDLIGGSTLRERVRIRELAEQTDPRLTVQRLIQANHMAEMAAGQAGEPMLHVDAGQPGTGRPRADGASGSGTQFGQEGEPRMGGAPPVGGQGAGNMPPGSDMAAQTNIGHIPQPQAAQPIAPQVQPVVGVLQQPAAAAPTHSAGSQAAGQPQNNGVDGQPQHIPAVLQPVAPPQQPVFVQGGGAQPQGMAQNYQGQLAAQGFVMYPGWQPAPAVQPVGVQPPPAATSNEVAQIKTQMEQMMEMFMQSQRQFQQGPRQQQPRQEEDIEQKKAKLTMPTYKKGDGIVNLEVWWGGMKQMRTTCSLTSFPVPVTRFWDIIPTTLTDDVDLVHACEKGQREIERTLGGDQLGDGALNRLYQILKEYCGKLNPQAVQNFSNIKQEAHEDPLLYSQRLRRAAVSVHNVLDTTEHNLVAMFETTLTNEQAKRQVNNYRMEIRLDMQNLDEAADRANRAYHLATSDNSKLVLARGLVAAADGGGTASRQQAAPTQPQRPSYQKPAWQPRQVAFATQEAQPSAESAQLANLAQQMALQMQQMQQMQQQTQQAGYAMATQAQQHMQVQQSTPEYQHKQNQQGYGAAQQHSQQYGSQQGYGAAQQQNQQGYGKVYQGQHAWGQGRPAVAAAFVQGQGQRPNNAGQGQGRGFQNKGFQPQNRGYQQQAGRPQWQNNGARGDQTRCLCPYCAGPAHDKEQCVVYAPQLAEVNGNPEWRPDNPDALRFWMGRCEVVGWWPPSMRAARGLAAAGAGAVPRLPPGNVPALLLPAPAPRQRAPGQGGGPAVC